MSGCTVILTGRSLFAEGVASRLRQHLHQLDLEVIDPQQADAMEQIATAQPTVIILDATDSQVGQLCPLSELLSLVPSAKIVQLDPRREQIQVVTSEQKMVGKVSDLIEMIIPTD